MARLSSIKRIGPEIVAGAPDWAKRLVDLLNPFIEEVHGALSRALTFPENVAGTIREFSFETKSNYTAGTAGWDAIRFETGLAVRAIDVAILQLNEVGDNAPVITSAVSLDWTEIDGEIVIRYVAGLANSKKFFLRVRAS